MKKILFFTALMFLMSNLYGDDEDLPQSICFGNGLFESYTSTLINSASNILESGTNFVEKELMTRQPDKIWPTKHASDKSITHSQDDYEDKFGHNERNSFTVQNAWLHSS